MLHDLSIVGSFITGASMGIAAALVLFSVMWHMLLNDKSEPTRAELRDMIAANTERIDILKRQHDSHVNAPGLHGPRVGSFAEQLPPRADIDKQLLDEATRTSRALVRMADNLESRTVMLEQQHAIINRELFPYQHATRLELIERQLTGVVADASMLLAYCDKGKPES